LSERAGSIRRRIDNADYESPLCVPTTSPCIPDEGAVGVRVLNLDEPVGDGLARSRARRQGQRCGYVRHGIVKVDYKTLGTAAEQEATVRIL
jgi:hypothetical protein